MEIYIKLNVPEGLSFEEIMERIYDVAKCNTAIGTEDKAVFQSQIMDESKGYIQINPNDSWYCKSGCAAGQRALCFLFLIDFPDYLYMSKQLINQQN